MGECMMVEYVKTHFHHSITHHDVGYGIIFNFYNYLTLEFLCNFCYFYNYLIFMLF